MRHYAGRPCLAMGLLGGLILLLAAGCGPPAAKYPSAKLGGTVTIAGKPVEDGTIIFLPTGAKQCLPTQAKIVQGRYQAEQVTLLKNAAKDVRYFAQAMTEAQVAGVMSPAVNQSLSQAVALGFDTPDKLLGYLSGVPAVYGADERPKKLEWMIRQAKSIAGK